MTPEMKAAIQVLNRRTLLKGGAATTAAMARRGVGRAAASEIVLNDASLLNPTPVARELIAPNDASLIASLRRELKEAAASGRPVAVGAARHSMGGQSLPRHGTAV